MLNGHIEYYFLPQYEMCQASSQQFALPDSGGGQSRSSDKRPDTVLR